MGDTVMVLCTHSLTTDMFNAAIIIPTFLGRSMLIPMSFGSSARFSSSYLVCRIEMP